MCVCVCVCVCGRVRISGGLRGGSLGSDKPLLPNPYIILNYKIHNLVSHVQSELQVY